MSTKRLIQKVVARTMKLNFRMWRFGEAIALRGLLSASRVTGDPEPLGYSLALLRAYVAGGVAKSNLEHVAPATELLSAYTLTGEPGFLEATRKLADMHGSFPTNKFGARLHRSDLPGWGRQIWVDCMDMDPPFLARLGSITGEETYFRQATEEILCYARLLQDPQSGLFYHGFEESCGQNGQLWARGNGWALMGLVETLKLLPKLDSHQSELTRRLIAQCRGLAQYQHPEGLWHTVLPHSETYQESTLATMAAWALREAFSAGILDEAEFGAMERKAREAVMRLIAEDGSLELVSDATPVGEMKMYATRPFGIFPWGQGALLLMMAQT